MDTIDTTELALVERLESRRQQLREAEEGFMVAEAGPREAEAGLDLYRRNQEIERQFALDHALALTLQETENRDQRLRNDEEGGDSLRETDDEGTGQRTCVACLDDFSEHDTHRSPCGHDWCRTCIVNRYDMAAKSTHLFPAQCCDEPILPDNHELIAPETWLRYFQKKTQVETPNPTFCSSRHCSKFIPLQHIDEGQARLDGFLGILGLGLWSLSASTARMPLSKRQLWITELLQLDDALDGALDTRRKPIRAAMRIVGDVLDLSPYLLPTVQKIFMLFSIMDICLDHLDLQTRSLVIKILRQDADEAKAKMRGKPGQLVYDSKIAFDAYLADLEAQTAFLLDKAMAESIAQAVHRDDDIVAAALAQERQAASDRRAALQLHEHGRLPQIPQRSQPAENAEIDDELRAKLEARYNLPPRDDNEDIYSADIPIQNLSLRPKKVRPCLICTESFAFHDLARLPCAHEYCRGCLQELFTKSLTDETLFPARCCRKNIPVTEIQIQIFLGGQLVGKYLAKKVEMETPNRTYCHRPACSTFVPRQGIKNDIATCPKCHDKTCSICKAAAHKGTDCPKDEAAQQLLDLAKEQGWKQCYACNKLVELTVGCNHMTCRCGAQFCYICGAIWKEKGQPGACSCEVFDENTLYRQAAQDAARDPGFHQQPQARQRQIVQQRRARIARNHACQHTDWTSERGVFTCHQCNDVMPKYILQCRRCNLELCDRCKRNRLR
ncbi:hypothetical protein INS49_002768 [Diaporthe citri]|uniref:uncharacterized protein n=1 Tax=Diaporthe citri TaxID=83186 RepID=UPI001C826D75|nr:uncharacterized protein INS49_002768 [Diaporthe citri]KAG6368555.1 hypothetical protein INS49_002768 [Diaporthe citri]